MARYKATFIFDFHEDESRSAVFDKIKQFYQALGTPNPQTRRALQYYLLEDIQEDVGRRIVDGTNYDIKDRATTYNIISWEKLTDD
jgi:cytochrome oxidase assembly protein ShyY1